MCIRDRLYGVIDTGIGYNKVSGEFPSMDATGTVTKNDVSGSRIGMINGVQAGSRWGLRGSEDLDVYKRQGCPRPRR